MLRHPVLRDLSRDHHLLLVHAQRMQRAVEQGPKEALASCRAFLQYWSEAVAPHFEEELRYVVPATPESSLQGRYNMIEEGLRTAVDEVRTTLMDPQFFRASILRVLPLIRVHVNFCEATLFEDVQDNLDEAGMKKLGAEMVAYRRVRRPGSMGTTRSEACYIDNPPPLPP